MTCDRWSVYYPPPPITDSARVTEKPGAEAPEMGGRQMITFVILAVVFVTGAIAGVIALVCLSIGREESSNSLYHKAPTRGAAATRRLLGWHGPASHHVRADVVTSATPHR